METQQNMAQPPAPMIQGDAVAIPANQMPGYRTWKAIQNKVEKNLLFRTWGGLGDQICAEPTLRYAFGAFKDCEITLASEQPSLYRHLNFKRVFNLKEEQPIWAKYFLFDTIVPPTSLTWQFFSHCITNCVDFPSLCALRCQLPTKDREIYLVPEKPSTEVHELVSDGHSNRRVFIHPGRHWPSKTFPKAWWDSVMSGLIGVGLIPVIIGGDTDDNRGTVDVMTEGCVDLRNKISIMDSIWLLQRARVLLTNDSVPLHMAASVDPRNYQDTGNCWTGYIATCKHPDYITHFRKGVWQWREENLGLGGIWEITDHCPNKEQDISVEFVSEEQLLKWLPEPGVVVEWALNKINS
jgi:Glycosyltransferase family 9 (heptosyltransferase)